MTFTDDAGNEETLTSTPTEPVLDDGPPGAPGKLTITAGDRELTLSWEPPDDNGNASGRTYRVEWRMEGQDYHENHWAVASKTTYTKTHLANGISYTFQVKAKKGNGYGPPSEEVSGTPTSGSAVDLDTPVLSEPETLHHGMVKLDWEDIADAGWYEVQYYHIDRGGVEWLDLPAVGVDVALYGSSAVVSNLDGLSWLRVRAVSCAGASEWSEIEQFGTRASDWEDIPVPALEAGDEIEPCPVDLGAPVLSKPEALHHGMVKLDWEDIEDAGWYEVQYYHIDQGSVEWLDLPAVGVDVALYGSSAVVSNLDGLSWLRVRAVSCAGASEWSEIEQFGTRASDWERVPVPTVEAGDETESCTEDLDTPVPSEPDGDNSPATSAATDVVAAATQPNNPATGAPTISGTAQVGETLTADTSGISDADGLSNVSYSYQWLADDAAIAGATANTYTLADSDEGKTVTVQVSFTDDGGNEETLTSAATDAVTAAPQANSPATGAPAITGTVQVGETLTADTSGIADEDGVDNVSFSYQWLADDEAISGAVGSTYTLVEADESTTITVQVSFIDDEGNEEESTSAPTATVEAATQPNNPATGAPTISGTAQVGETLTADTSGIVDEDGLSNAAFNYQWISNDGTSDTDITGATNSTYTLVEADVGKAIKVEVSFTDDAGNGETLTSSATDAVAAALSTIAPGEPGNLRLTPVLLGTNGVGIKVSWDKPTESGSSDIVGYHVQWKSGGENYGDDQATRRAFVADSPYTVDTTSQTSTEGEEFTVRVSAVNDARAGSWTEGAKRLPSYNDLELWLLMQKYAQERKTTFPWVLETLNYLDVNEVPVEVRSELQFAGQATLDCPPSNELSDGGLKVCSATGVAIKRLQKPRRRTIIHEMAHVFTLSNRVTDTPGPLAMGHLYFASLNLEGDNYGCDPRELYADVIVLLTLGNGSAGYWQPCNGGNAGLQDQALAVVGSAVSGETPQWFADTYNNSEGNPDLERVWADVKGLPDSRDIAAVVYQLRNEFGGYCNNKATRYALDYADETLHQPWRDGGCPPAAPSSLEVASGDGELTLVWNAPASDGGSDVEGYIVQWRSGYQLFYGWAASQRRVVLASPASLTYTISGLTNGVEYDVRVLAYNHIGDGQSHDVESVTPNEAATPPLPEDSPALGAPTISGTAQVGEMLSANVSGIADADGLTNATFSYQWLADDAAIAGATGNTYTLTDSDEGEVIKVRVSFTDDAGHEETLTSAATEAVAAAPQPNSPATGAPTVSGTAQVGETLTADTSGIADENGLENVTFTYQWLADNAAIAGATGSTHTLADDDEGKAIKVQVSFTDDAGNDETLTSAATDAVAAPEPPASPTGLSATASHDSVTLSWDDPGDDSITGYVILRRNRDIHAEGEFTTLVKDTGAAATTYTDDSVAAETPYTYRIKAINEHGESERSRWFHIDTPAAPDPADLAPAEPPASPTGLAADVSHDSVTLTWDDPGDDSITGYVILRRNRDIDAKGEFTTLVEDTGAAATTYTDDTVEPETPYTYRIKAINEHGESERSRWFHIQTQAAP